MRPIRIGLGAWPAAAPFAWPWRQGMVSWPTAEVAVSDAHELDERMSLGTLTVGLVSPAAYLQHQDRWVVSRSVALTADRPGAAVALLFSRHDLSLLDGTHMAIPPAGGSEPALLEALLRDRYDLVVTPVAKRGPVDSLLLEYPAALMIGERALIAAQQLPPGVKVHDLTDLWLEVTGLPYPAGLWACQKVWAQDHAEAWTEIQNRLGQAKDVGLLMADALIADLQRRLPLSESRLRQHLACYRYDVPPELPAALTRFAGLAGLPTPTGFDGPG